MKRVEDYRRRARECRDWSNAVSDTENQKLLLDMARLWDVLARHREELLARERELAR